MSSSMVSAAGDLLGRILGLDNIPDSDHLPASDLPATLANTSQPATTSSGTSTHGLAQLAITPPAPTLPWNLYPVVFDTILSHADTRTLCTLALTSSGVARRAAAARRGVDVVYDPRGVCPARALFPHATKGIQQQDLSAPPHPLGQLGHIVVVLRHDPVPEAANFPTPPGTRPIKGKTLTLLLPPVPGWGTAHELMLQRYLCHTPVDALTIVGYAQGRTPLRAKMAQITLLRGIATMFPYHVPEHDTVFRSHEEHKSTIGAAAYAQETRYWYPHTEV